MSSLPSLQKLMRDALQDLIDNYPYVPERNCSCHLSPPCNDCVDWSGSRESIRRARELIKAHDDDNSNN